ncbi:DUF4296 domain-containing protein [Christiangramia sabulilitoris]|uniref:DUF4296 domain-containing protein n=1 Tax=Christiangramia sabulilitoris TaxID=2583991 RepID=A0A550I048_9FLAO|nr:DUF4296 domain-containing protein [Christiangramia sabulilitoris]TRO64315.1 DUF4296 domain-containing protein [Christiangramia sabulilitoris]
MIDNLNIKILFVLLLLFSVSCQNLEKTERPEDLIPEDQMIDVLTEIALLNAARNYNKQKLESTGIDPTGYVFAKYNIDSLQFERSNDYYAEQYSDYERIYDSVKVRLQVIKTRMDSLRAIEVKIEDSIKLARKDSLRRVDSLGLRIIDSVPVKTLKAINKDSIRQKKDSLIVPAVKFDASMNRQG